MKINIIYFFLFNLNNLLYAFKYNCNYNYKLIKYNFIRKEIIIHSKLKLNDFEKKYNSKTENQDLYKNALYNKYLNIVICEGPAGTGKTTLASEYAIELLCNKKIKKIIITRPTKTLEEDLGFLPGDINQKMFPWTIPIFDIFKEYLLYAQIETLVKKGIIEICPLGFIQGRTFKDTIIIADEMQNSSPNQMFMLLTRIGTNSKIIINGDLKQTKSFNGLEDIINKLNKHFPTNENKYKHNISLVHLYENDVLRHPVIKTILNLYK